jgi:hypothetical protein
MQRVLALQLLVTHCTENSKKIFPEMKLDGLVPNFCIHVSVSDLYISPIGLPTVHILLFCVCGPIVGIYKFITDTFVGCGLHLTKIVRVSLVIDYNSNNRHEKDRDTFEVIR